jgi:hypothetical protein
MDKELIASGQLAESGFDFNVNPRWQIQLG